jgi:hypothetical protein
MCLTLEVEHRVAAEGLVPPVYEESSDIPLKLEADFELFISTERGGRHLSSEQECKCSEREAYWFFHF